MKMELPVFRYHADPVETGSIEHKETKCPVCKQKREYVDVGPFFAIEDVEGICPWCIANGSAAKKYDGEFQDSASIESPVEDKFMDELVHRTPGYMAWQQEQWLIHCEEPLLISQTPNFLIFGVCDANYWFPLPRKVSAPPRWPRRIALQAERTGAQSPGRSNPRSDPTRFPGWTQVRLRACTSSPPRAGSSMPR
jgi:hypothetical protein